MVLVSLMYKNDVTSALLLAVALRWLFGVKVF